MGKFSKKQVDELVKKELKQEKRLKEPKESKVAKAAPTPPKPAAAPASLLTDAQKKIARDMFAKYDLPKLTSDQAKIILKVLETSGIHGPALEEAAALGGLDPKKFLALAQGGQLVPPPPPKSN